MNSLKAQRLINQSLMQPLAVIEKEILLQQWSERLEATSTDLSRMQIDLALLSSEVDAWPRVQRLITPILETIMQREEDNG